MSTPPFRRMIVSLVARILVPELDSKFSLRVAKTAVNGETVTLPEAIGLDIQQFDFTIRKSNADVKRSLGFNVLTDDTPSFQKFIYSS